LESEICNLQWPTANPLVKRKFLSANPVDDSCYKRPLWSSTGERPTLLSCWIRFDATCDELPRRVRRGRLEVTLCPCDSIRKNCLKSAREELRKFFVTQLEIFGETFERLLVRVFFSIA